MAKAIPHGTNNGYQWYKCRCDECVAAHKLYRRKHYEANRDRTNELLKAWRKAHPEKTSEQRRRYHAANPEKEAERGRRFREANPDYARLWREANPNWVKEWGAANPERWGEIKRLGDHRRRARMRDAFVEDVPRLEIFERDGWKCLISGCFYPDVPASIEVRWPDPLLATMDHVIPLAKGGTHERANLVCAHLRCNIVKNDRLEGIA